MRQLLDTVTRAKFDPLPVAHANSFLRQLSPADLDLLMEDAKAIPLKPRAVLHEAGETIGTVYFPTAGSILIANLMRSGGAAPIAVVGCDSVIGALEALGTQRASDRAVVHMPGEAIALTLASFRAAANQSRAIVELTLRFSQARLASAQQSVLCNARHSAEARLCSWIVRFYDYSNAAGIPLTQDHLAQILGLRRTTIVHVAGRLQRAGVITCRRGSITVMNCDELESRACECCEALRSGRL
jgi:CRP-like cAMP-binding protein